MSVLLVLLLFVFGSFVAIGRCCLVLARAGWNVLLSTCLAGWFGRIGFKGDRRRSLMFVTLGLDVISSVLLLLIQWWTPLRQLVGRTLWT